MTAPTIATPIDRFIAEQRDLSAVERFARIHDSAPAGVAAVDRASRYRDLLPASPPRPGQQYAFDVDLDACSGCKACVAACNRLNGLDADESWRTVGVLVGLDEPYRQTVTTTCHHCLDPGCLSGCPVEAYEKDPVTGIVHHLDDQCIGCGYCVFTCPYEVPRLNRSRGIVRKCDMCSGRLAEGEAPACVQACPTSAISITVVDVDDVSARAARGEFLPGAPAPQATRPSTRYRSARAIPEAVRAGDSHSLHPAGRHPALAFMLVLTQVAVGAALVPPIAGALGVDGLGAGRGWGSAVVLLAGLAALGGSLLHLGRPRYAFRALLGLRRSWLSREILAFSAFAVVAAVHAGLSLLGPFGSATGLLGLGVVATGVAGVGCSVAIYVATGRAVWSPVRTGVLFGSTTLAGGTAVTLVGLVAAGAFASVAPMALAMAVLAVAKLGAEASTVRHRRRGDSELARSAILLTRDLAAVVRVRAALGVVGGVVFPLWLVALTAAGPSAFAILVASASAALWLAGELVERQLFFAAAVAPRMPGGYA